MRFYCAVAAAAAIVVLQFATEAESESAEEAADALGLESVRQLFKQMDDDHSGSIDPAESTEFVREELHISEKDRMARRQKAFHKNNDDAITVEDLWRRWLACDERKWSVDETVAWLTDGVELPQYAETFQRNAVDGRALPRLHAPPPSASTSGVFRLAVQNASFLVNILGVQNAVHRQKLQLKAMDVVLFGYRTPPQSLLKDVLLVVLLVVLSVMAIGYRSQRVNSRRQLNQLSSQMSELQSMEGEFQSMQSELDKTKEALSEQASIQESEKSDLIDSLRMQLNEAERRLERGGSLGAAPLALQPLLRKTFELESGHISQQRMDGLREMREAMEMVEKLRRKQSSVVSSLKLAVGAGAGTDDLDARISKIKQRMERSARLLDECQSRWLQIESLCGFSVLGGAGLIKPSSCQPIDESDEVSSVAQPGGLTTNRHSGGSLPVRSASYADALFAEARTPESPANDSPDAAAAVRARRQLRTMATGDSAESATGSVVSANGDKKKTSFGVFRKKDKS